MGKIEPASAPFLDESKAECDENDMVNKIRSASAAALDKYPNSPKGQAKAAALSQGGGMLAHIASAVLMKILYAARMGRFDLLRPVTALGSRITTWTKLCDVRLHRLMCYIKGSLDVRMHAWLGRRRKGQA